MSVAVYLPYQYDQITEFLILTPFGVKYDGH
jgi:hypothetical protein